MSDWDETIKRVENAMSADIRSELAITQAELATVKARRNRDRNRIAEAINRLQPDGMNPNMEVITYLRAIKLMIWDETMEPEEALKLAESQMPKGTDT